MIIGQWLQALNGLLRHVTEHHQLRNSNAYILRP